MKTEYTIPNSYSYNIPTRNLHWVKGQRNFTDTFFLLVYFKTQHYWYSIYYSDVQSIDAAR